MLRILLFIIFITPNILSAYQSQIEVARINDEPILSGEFLYAFNKNRNKENPVTQDSLLQYLDQFINFKLKVKAAQSLGIDTSATFLNEFNAYTEQIKKPYLQNSNLDAALIEEAYDRLQFELNVSHILVRIQKSASPSDTLRTFNKISALRNRAINGEDFAELARKNSEDGSASAGGELGYFTTFGMVYPFESAAYETPKGDISEIIRSQFGYHIVKVLDKRAARGRLKTAHIFITGSNKSPKRAEEIIQQAYDSLLNGGDWRTMCATFSEDTNTKLKGGSLPFYGIGQFPEPLLNAGFELDTVGQFSAPVKSRFGWHILKLEAKEPIKPLNEIRSDIVNNIKRSGRNQSDKAALIKKLKNENGFEQDTSLINNLINSLVQSETISRRPTSTTIFKIGTVEIRDNDFIGHLLDQDKIEPVSNNSLWVHYQQFEYDELIKCEETLIPTKYPEHQYLINEYREGIMLFEIMESKVWNKAIEDSIGLAEFYKIHKKDFPANQRAEVYVIAVDSIDMIPRIKEVTKNANNIEALKRDLEKDLSTEQMASLKIVKRRFEQNELPIFAGNHWKSGSLIADPTHSKLYWIDKIIPEGFYELNEIKGLVISDYQDALDADWIKALRKKEKIKINKKAVSSLVVIRD
jgi:peptidyl-prolyl cis-trans isomerase SurA